jgi:hypothetical protein
MQQRPNGPTPFGPFLFSPGSSRLTERRNKVHKKTGLIATAALALCAVACGTLVDRIAGGQDMKKVSELWADVPKMDGMTSSDLEMPVATKLILRTIIGNLGRFNKEGESQTTGDIDWMAFTTAKPSTDVRAFYTNEKMTESGGWDASKESTCIDGKEKGASGVFCVFQKKVDGRPVGLIVVAAEDEAARQTNVFFVRIEAHQAAPQK